MICPKCGLERSGANAECARCGIVFSKWKPAPPPAPPRSDAAVPAVPPASPSPAPAPRTGSHLLSAGIVLAVGLLILQALRPIPGRPVPDGASVKTEDGFAMAPGPEWIALTPENVRAVMEKAGARLPTTFAEALRGAIASGGLALAFTRISNAGESATPFVNVVVIPGRPRPLDDEERALFVETAVRRYRELIPDFTVKSSGPVTVDGVPSARMEGSGSIRTKVSNAVVTNQTSIP